MHPHHRGIVLLYICIPTYNEGPTVGVLLWRIRRVFQDYSREYEIIVYDDGSTDGTRETLEPYSEVIPLTVLRGDERKGYGFALDKLCREVSRRTRYARRDALIVMQADFTDQPEHIPELVKRFEGGADIVAAKPGNDRSSRLRCADSGDSRAGSSAPACRRPGDADPFTTFRLYRISVLRELLQVAWRQAARSPATAGRRTWSCCSRRARSPDAWKPWISHRATTCAPARRRIRPFADAMNLFRFSRERAICSPLPAGGAA